MKNDHFERNLVIRGGFGVNCLLVCSYICTLLKKLDAG
jgi:hypothetical protein